MSEKTGFKRQGFLSANCGQRALIHALLILGIQISEEKAYRVTGLSKVKVLLSGTDDKNLIRGIRKCGCRALPHLFHDEEKTERKLRQYLGRGIPVIILINNARHWMVLSSVDSTGRIHWIDSSDRKLFGRNAWRTVASWMGFEEDGKECYYFIGVKPGKALRRDTKSCR